jgi:guanylate kinase
MDSAVDNLLKNYKPNQSVIDLIKTTPILLLVGPTGAGKDSLKDRLLETGEYHHIVSHILQGVGEYKAFDQGVMAVFLLPPDFETWQARLQRRYGDVVDAADHRLRLQTALDELTQLLTTPNYTAIVNDDIEEVLAEVRAYARSHTADSKKEAAAREVAKKLAEDIRNYLQQTR